MSDLPKPLTAYDPERPYDRTINGKPYLGNRAKSDQEIAYEAALQALKAKDAD